MESALNLENPQSYGYNNKQRYHDLIFKTALYFNLTAIDLISKKRTKVLTEPRFMLWRHAYQTGHYGVAFLGQHTGARHHTTVLNGLVTITNMIRFDDIAKKTFEEYHNYMLNS